MSQDEKEAPAPRLGIDLASFKKYKQEQLARPTQWAPGVRVASAAEYEQFTDQLAKELMATCTPEHLAVIAAQHMMYADELKCVLEETITKPGASPKDDFELAGRLSIIIHTSYRRRLSKKRADAVRAGKKDAKALACEIAAEEWRNDTEQKIRAGEMERIVFNRLKETAYRNQVSSEQAVGRWITPVKPSYASKAGRQHKSNNRYE